MSDEGNNDGLGGSAEALARMNLRTIGDGRVLRIMSMYISTGRGSRKANDDDSALAREGKEGDWWRVAIHVHVRVYVCTLGPPSAANLVRLRHPSTGPKSLSLCNNQVVLSELVRALRSCSVSKIRLLSEQTRALRSVFVGECAHPRFAEDAYGSTFCLYNLLNQPFSSGSIRILTLSERS